MDNSEKEIIEISEAMKIYDEKVKYEACLYFNNFNLYKIYTYNNGNDNREIITNYGFVLRLKNNTKFKEKEGWKKLKENIYFLNKENILMNEEFFIEEYDFDYESVDVITQLIENKNRNLRKINESILA